MSLLGYLGLRDFMYAFDLHFTLAHKTITIHDGGYRLTHQAEDQERAAVGEPGIKQTMLWRFKVHKLVHNDCMVLGINSRPPVSQTETAGNQIVWLGNDSRDSEWMYGWACNAYLYEPKVRRDAIWDGFRQGDEVVMKLDMESSALFMHAPRLVKTFRIDLPPKPAWYIYASILREGDSVELLPAMPKDASLFD